ncbi:hypothetical protein FGG08_002115 [Glutinoglossum americanum]|uniref:Uncharacterized protein n=1 Tax=Glutinoglossum americanum TaxID=1670608 RepID=A0A9P8L4R2_9PEZI|nr:hypothetical protein FGG08_002115 [Glutinoglossum americanum]
MSVISPMDHKNDNEPRQSDKLFKLHRARARGARGFKPAPLLKEDKLCTKPVSGKKLRVRRIPIGRGGRGEFTSIPDQILNKAEIDVNTAELKAVISKMKESNKGKKFGAISEDLTNVLDLFETTNDRTGKVAQSQGANATSYGGFMGGRRTSSSKSNQELP